MPAAGVMCGVNYPPMIEESMVSLSQILYLQKLLRSVTLYLLPPAGVMHYWAWARHDSPNSTPHRLELQTWQYLPRRTGNGEEGCVILLLFGGVRFWQGTDDFYVTLVQALGSRGDRSRLIGWFLLRLSNFSLVGNITDHGRILYQTKRWNSGLSLNYDLVLIISTAGALVVITV